MEGSKKEESCEWVMQHNVLKLTQPPEGISDAHVGDPRPPGILQGMGLVNTIGIFTHTHPCTCIRKEGKKGRKGGRKEEKGRRGREGRTKNIEAQTLF
jgi:hypothetical protein